ncbi:hypothetical protein AWR27_01275 [Spirosoma montaniterrae]|uniref:Yip1 domain-containing protein n=1 Tax=Spirosoma montaniterrae TaxID=1178516 RepID=A0A1P9WRX5_9BACT|nr:hypothetical protein AWR27_01275 [Spirosoma montaniterrae]
MLVLQAAFQYLLFSENLYFNALQTQLSYEQIERIITQGKKWQWVGYVLTPILLLMKFSFFAACLSLGLYFASNRFAFKPFWNFLVQAELIFLLPILIKLLWFLFVQTDYDLDDLTQFYPLSALNLFDADTLPRYWHYPLATLNLFEVAYWFLLAYGVNEVTDLSFWRAFGLVMSSYGLGLLVWVVLVMFLTITYA